MNTKVDILLATFNGEKYLQEQIDSILSQSYQDFQLIIRDDGSTDNTLEVIQKAILQFPEKIFMLKDNEHLGVIKSFSKLIESSNAAYIMFADQDDIWMHHKVSKTLEKMLELQSLHGVEKPLLVHSDLKVVDEKLSEISSSYWSYARLYPREGTHLNRLLVQNEITGCTVMINRSLAELSKPIFSGCVMHDWWLGLIAASFGNIGVIKEPLILYRQHGKNTLGAKKFGLSLIKNKSNLDTKKRDQAEALLKNFQSHLCPKKSKMVADYISLKNVPILQNRYLLLKHRFFRQTLLRNLYCFFLKRVP